MNRLIFIHKVHIAICPLMMNQQLIIIIDIFTIVFVTTMRANLKDEMGGEILSDINFKCPLPSICRLQDSLQI